MFGAHHIHLCAHVDVNRINNVCMYTQKCPHIYIYIYVGELHRYVSGLVVSTRPCHIPFSRRINATIPVVQSAFISLSKFLVFSLSSPYFFYFSFYIYFHSTIPYITLHYLTLLTGGFTCGSVV